MELKLVQEFIHYINIFIKVNKYPKLFPRKFRIAGIILFVPAILISIFRFQYGIKPDFLKLKVFTFYSSFVETKYFTLIENNLSDEICALILFASIILIVFSKEENEVDELWEYRFSSMFIAVYANIGITALSIILVFGLAFIKIIILEIYLTPIIYFIVFKIKSRDLKNQISTKN